jgi:hypothetical protein
MEVTNPLPSWPIMIALALAAYLAFRILVGVVYAIIFVITVFIPRRVSLKVRLSGYRLAMSWLERSTIFVILFALLLRDLQQFVEDRRDGIKRSKVGSP